MIEDLQRELFGPEDESDPFPEHVEPEVTPLLPTASLCEHATLPGGCHVRPGGQFSVRK